MKSPDPTSNRSKRRITRGIDVSSPYIGGATRRKMKTLAARQSNYDAQPSNVYSGHLFTRPGAL